MVTEHYEHLYKIFPKSIVEIDTATAKQILDGSKETGVSNYLKTFLNNKTSNLEHDNFF